MKTTENYDGLAKQIARRVIDGSMGPDDGCVALAALCRKNNYPDSLIVFDLLAHEQTDHEQFGIDKGNTAPLIVEECRKLLELA